MIRARIYRALGLMCVLLASNTAVAQVPAATAPTRAPEQFAPATRAPAVAKGELAFSQRKWQEAIGQLVPEWQRGNKQFRLGYYIGASYCNLSHYSTGQQWLSHTLERQNPPAQSAQIIADGRARCVPTAAPSTMVINTSEWSRSAELLYYGAGTRLRFREVSGAQALPGAVLAERLAGVGDAAAVKRTAALLDAALARPEDAGEACAAGGPVRTEVVGRFLFVTRARTASYVLKGWGDALEYYVQSLSRRFDMAIPQNMITVHLARCPGDARMIARQVHGLDFSTEAIAGYSVQEDMSLLAIWEGYTAGQIGKEDSAAMRTVRHELAHLMLREWFGDAPKWLDEGLAQYLGVTANGPAQGRTTVLHSSWGPLPGLGQIIAPGPPLPVADAGCIDIAQRMMAADATRMFLAYVDGEPGRLARLLQTMRAYGPGDGPGKTDRQLVEEALGLPLDELDAAYRKASLIGVDDSLFEVTSAEACSG